ENRDQRPAPPRPAEPETTPARGPLDDPPRAVAVAANGAPCLPLAPLQRNLALRPAAAIDAIRLLPGGGHAEDYGTHGAGGAGDRGGPRGHEDPRRERRPRWPRRPPARAGEAAGTAGTPPHAARA